MEIEAGATYRTSVAIWTVEHIFCDGMILFRRDDGRTAKFSAKAFAGWIIEKVAPR